MAVARLRRTFTVLGVLTYVALLGSCADTDEGSSEESSRPNILWIVWDTVRADHLSLYGYAKPTTPYLERWARGARVFEDCVSTAPHTVPSHASMFTGLLPSEHGVERPSLKKGHTTVAELLREAGYQTFLYSANPHIAGTDRFAQGFDVEEHPWDEKYSADALRILQAKVPQEDRSSEKSASIRSGHVGPWGIKATGQLAQRGVKTWLSARDPARPYFIFLNYMEAHRPYYPPKKYRSRLMTPAQVDESYRIDRSWVALWSYTFGLRDYTSAELEVMAATYDATLIELDELFHRLLEFLEAGGYLQNTVVILTADHGEQLGEHHMLDHQYSLYDPLLRVPLVIHFPKRFAPGREKRPVMNFDLFPTLLDLAGIEQRPELRSEAVSLMTPPERRVRLSEYTVAPSGPLGAVQESHTNWDPTPWRRQLRALTDDAYKFIWSSDARHELYNIHQDAGELHNLINDHPAVSQRMKAKLDSYLASLRHPVDQAQPPPAISDKQRAILESLGYIQPPADGD